MPDIAGITGDQLKSYIERIERLEEEKANIGQDIKEVFAEAKGNGFDTKVMRQILKIRKMDAAEREELDELLDLYLQAMGMLPTSQDDAEREPDVVGGIGVREEVGEPA